MKLTCLSVLILFALNSNAGEWIAIGEQKAFPIQKEFESNMWKYLTKTNIEFQPREKYRFQYQFLNHNIVHVNALCIPKPQKNSPIGTYPGPTNEYLRSQLYVVEDGGSCFFNFNYNIKKRKFSELYVNGLA